MADDPELPDELAGFIEKLSQLEADLSSVSKRFEVRTDLVGEQTKLDEGDVDTFLEYYRLLIRYATMVEAIPGGPDHEAFKGIYSSVQDSRQRLEGVIRYHMTS